MTCMTDVGNKCIVFSLSSHFQKAAQAPQIVLLRKFCLTRDFFMLLPRCESLDYLCDIATRMKLHGLDPTAKPKENADNGL